MSDPMLYEFANKLLKVKVDRIPGTDEFANNARAHMRLIQAAISENMMPVIDISHIAANAIDFDGDKLDMGYCDSILASVDVNAPLPFKDQLLIWRHPHTGAAQAFLAFTRDGQSAGGSVVVLDAGGAGVGFDGVVDPDPPPPISVGAMTLTLLVAAINSCANASWVDGPVPTRAIRRRLPSVAGIRFRHVVIKEATARGSKHHSDDPTHGVAWHRRRGHIATYTAERPLFGRFVGRVWRSDAIVGDKKHGIIVQDYEVKPPNR